MAQNDLTPDLTVEYLYSSVDEWMENQKTLTKDQIVRVFNEYQIQRSRATLARGYETEHWSPLDDQESMQWVLQGLLNPFFPTEK